MKIKTVIAEKNRGLIYDYDCTVTTEEEINRFVDRVALDLKVQGRTLMNAKQIVGDNDNSRQG